MLGKHLSHYKILDELGRGGMGVVYKAEDTKLHRTVAIKVLPAAALASEDEKARFYREARSAASLSHPNIATVYEIDESVPEGAKDDDLRPFIAMEFIEGETLEDRVKRGPMKLEEAVKLASQIAEGLKAAHDKEIVHRDVKAANVMLDSSNRAKILDFGLALTAQSTKLTRMGSTLGTVAYMSPEQARGEEVDQRTDIWALGITLYEMIAGTHPFGGDYEQAVVYSILNEDPQPLTAVRTGVSMELERIVSKCVAKQAKSRYQSMTDLLVDLENLDLQSVTSGLHSSSLRVAAPAPQSALGRFMMPTLAGLAGILLTFLVMMLNRSEDSQSTSWTIPIHVEGIHPVYYPQLNEDYSRLTFLSRDSLGQPGIYWMDMTTGDITTAVPIANGGFDFSDDGSTLFFKRGGDVMSMALPEGQPRKINTAPHSGTFLLFADNTVVIPSSGGKKMISIDPESGEERTLFHTDSLGFETGQIGGPIPGFDHKRGGFYFSIEFGLADHAPQLYFYDWDSKEAIHLIDGGLNGFLLGEDYLLYQPREGQELFAQKLDPNRPAKSGGPVKLMDTISVRELGATSDGGLLITEPEDRRVFSRKYSLSGELMGQVETSIQSDLTGRVDDFGVMAEKPRSWTDFENIRLVVIEKEESESGQLTGIATRNLGVTLGLVGCFGWNAQNQSILYSTFDGTDFQLMQVRKDGLTPSEFISDDPCLTYSNSGRFSVLTESVDSGLRLVLRDHRSDTDTELIPPQAGRLVWGWSFSPDESLVKILGTEGFGVASTTGDGSDIVHFPFDFIWDKNESAVYRYVDGNVLKHDYTTAGGFQLAGEPEVIISHFVGFEAGIWHVTDDAIYVSKKAFPDHSVVRWHQGFLETIEE